MNHPFMIKNYRSNDLYYENPFERARLKKIADGLAKHRATCEKKRKLRKSKRKTKY